MRYGLGRIAQALHPLRIRARRLMAALYPLERRIHDALRGIDDVRFVQVGSNDGKQGDPVHQLIRKNSRWSGMFIEPVPMIFERLKKNYQDEKRFVFENVAIGTTAGSSTFYYVSEVAKLELGEKLPYWHDQLGSFDRQHIVKHLDGLLTPYIVAAELPCLPLQTVLDRHAIARVDLLHIDTEGYDYEVLRQFDLARYAPKVVLFEHKHLSREARHDSRALLLRQGYTLHFFGGDTLGTKRS